MTRALRLLAAIGFIWIVGLFVLRLTGVVRGEPFTSSFAAYRLMMTMRGALCIAVGILALVLAAIRRQFLWIALFTVLLALLPIVALLILQPPVSAFSLFFVLFSAPELFGRYAWMTLTPALIPGAAFIYTLVAADGSHTVNERVSTAVDA
jgi:hypothetical protein